jgi:N-methylhydantoinase A
VLPAGESLVLRRAVDLRYSGQEHTISFSIDDDGCWQSLRERFDREHERTYGYGAPDVDLELLNLRLTGIVRIERPPLHGIRQSRDAIQPVEIRDVYSSRQQSAARTPVFDRNRLHSGDVIEGPAAIEEAATTTYIDFADRLVVNDAGFLIVEVARD